MALGDADLSELSLDDLLALADAGAETPGRVRAAGAPAAIAVIGMAGRVGGCDDLTAFWRLVRDGETARRGLPESRRADLAEFLRLEGASHGPAPLEESFLSDVDTFDHRFFGIAKQEADLIDPNQRLFLETAWTALEDAGYGGSGTRGSATGVYVGFSSDFGEDYRRIVRAHAPDAPEVAVAGNIKSIIASRIAYHLDLRGPALLVDTACSSGLVAVHLACRALRGGDCDMAIAGAVKVDLIPVTEDPQTGVGIKDIGDTIAGDGRTRTFDEACGGTSGAEGVLAFVLKPLDRALADGDTIHAVIRGSAVNQDGRSVGITAPNSAAQESVIVRALQDGGVHAESISYVEAHGTATRLGDPIEISGIQRAFRHFTPRRQFCAVGSVKTNIGHMDNAAGLAGLAKVILAMQNRALPPTLNFTRPNRNIAFEQSPTYVNDTLRPWAADGQEPLRAGVSAFGLSGTNCHVVLESAPAPAPRAAVPAAPFILPLSAGTEDGLRRLAGAYRARLLAYDSRPEDVAYTAAVGRQHHAVRLAITFDDVPGLVRLLDRFLAEGPHAWTEDMAFGRVRLVGDRRARHDASDLTDADRKQLDGRAAELASRVRAAEGDERRALVAEALALYVRGAEVPWDRWFAGTPCRRVPLPTYPFARTRCWVGTTRAAETRLARRRAPGERSHPLVGRLAVATHGFRVYESVLGAGSNWELADHKVRGTCVLPGTALLEMILEVAADVGAGDDRPVRVEQLLFLRPLALDGGDDREVHVVVADGEGARTVLIVSRPHPGGSEWEVHAEATLGTAGGARPAAADLERLAARLPEALSFARQDDVSRGLEIGDRWNLSFQQGWTSGAGDEILVRLALPARHRDEVARYRCHPALLDTAVNAANHLVAGGALYLPLSYSRLDVYGRLPAECYAHLRRKTGASKETFGFDIDILDTEGNVLARAADYTIKLVPDAEAAGASWAHVVTLSPRAPLPDVDELPAEPVLVVRRGVAEHAAVAAALRERGVRVIELVRGEGASLGQADALDAGAGLAGYERALSALETAQIAGVVYAAAWPGAAGDPDTGSLILDPGADLHDLLDFVTAFVTRKLRTRGPLLVLSRGAFAIDGETVPTAPHAAALAGLARVAGLEYPGVHVRSLDTDRLPDGHLLCRELSDGSARDLSVYREGARYAERLSSLPASGRRPFVPRRDGVYVITGGTGALGLEVAAALAAKGPVNLALVAPTPVPARDRWEAVLASGGGGKTARRARRLLEIEASGSRVECFAADAADAERMRGILEDLRTEFGRINGVVHAAGRAGDGFLVTKDHGRFERVLRPKIEGARVLHTLTLGDDLDLFVVFSSIATVLRNPGQGDYTAANAYLESLARYRRAMGLPAVAICWPAWREVGIAVEYGAVDEDEFFAPIDPATALGLLDAALGEGASAPPVVILAAINPRASVEAVEASGLELSETVLRSGGRPRARAASPNRPDAWAESSRPALTGIGDPDDVDLAVAGVWAKTLGVRELDADDVFTDVGGNSILTTQMYKAFESLYPGVLEVADLFTHTTIRHQAAYLRKSLGREAPAGAGEAPDTEMDRVLALLAKGDISADEAQAVLVA
jgi:acyl transferase domain-containing protein